MKDFIFLFSLFLSAFYFDVIFGMYYFPTCLVLSATYYAVLIFPLEKTILFSLLFTSFVDAHSYSSFFLFIILAVFIGRIWRFYGDLSRVLLHIIPLGFLQGIIFILLATFSREFNFTESYISIFTTIALSFVFIYLFDNIAYLLDMITSKEIQEEDLYGRL